MKYLLDTHTFIWSIIDSTKLSKKANTIIKNRDNIVSISTISLWEISLKVRMKKYSFSGLNILLLPNYAEKMGFSIISLNPEEAVSYCDLPLINDHKDPFDRMLIWQAIKRKTIIISKDQHFLNYKKYGLKCIWE
jgi:PIN domain nuclease of toxin-antitoxin system